MRKIGINYYFSNGSSNKFLTNLPMAMSLKSSREDFFPIRQIVFYAGLFSKF
jgi:hypothetical protein